MILFAFLFVTWLVYTAFVLYAWWHGYEGIDIYFSRWQITGYEWRKKDSSK